jgi:hypothetical protein
LPAGKVSEDVRKPRPQQIAAPPPEEQRLVQEALIKLRAVLQQDPKAIERAARILTFWIARK